MNEEKQYLLNKINNLISVNTTKLLNRIPSVHEIDDGIIIRYFTDWGDCTVYGNVKFKKIINKNDLNDITVYVFIPKDTTLTDVNKTNLNNEMSIESLICVSGELEIEIDGEIFVMVGSEKAEINQRTFTAIALKDTYLITLSK